MTPEAAAELLAKTAAAAKRAQWPTLSEIGKNISETAGTVSGELAKPSSVTSEAIRNALIGAGVGSIGGVASELSKDEQERDYSNLINSGLLGALMGGGGTLAWRNLADSGDPKNPAVFQKTYDEAFNPAPPSPAPPPTRLQQVLRGAAGDTELSQQSRQLAGQLSAGDFAGAGETAIGPWGRPIGAAFEGVSGIVPKPLAGGAAGLVAGSALSGLGNAAAHPGTFLARQGARLSNYTLRPLSGGAVPKFKPPEYKPSRLRGGLGTLIRVLGAGAGAYGASEL